MKDIIVRRRKELGLTQQELADKLFVSDKVISKWETGKSVPDTSILVELANVLGISLNELLKSEKDVTEGSIKSAMADKVDIKYKNVLLITSLFIVIGTILFFVPGLISYYYHRILVVMLYMLGILFLVFSIFYFLISRNKLIIDYPRFKEVDKKYINRLLVIYGIATFAITLLIALNNGLDFFELSIVLIIAVLIEIGVYILIYKLINRKNNY